MSLRPLVERTLVAYARPEAFVPRTQAILAHLGYRIVSADEFDGLPPGEDGEPRRPDLAIVDERRLGEIEEADGEGPLPLIVLTGRNGVTGADSRIVAAIKRPAGLHDIYRVVQQVFEEFPRATPRVSTHLRAVCRRRGKEWSGAVLSLSENGCLLRSTEEVPLGSEVDISFELPRIGRVQVAGETAYQLVPDLGLVFSSIEPDIRADITSYVTQVLSTA